MGMAYKEPDKIPSWVAAITNVATTDEIKEAAHDYEADLEKAASAQDAPPEGAEIPIIRTLHSRAHLDRMSPPARALRELFAQEYVYDFRPVEAAKRCGFVGKSAVTNANRLLSEPVVQRLIKEYQKEFSKRVEINQDEIIAGLWREAHREEIGSSHSARVAAYTQTAKILGIGKPEGPEVQVNIGGVMEVPASTSVEDWEKTAAEQQAKLRADVRD